MNRTIEWDENDVPIATRFDDPYFSKRNGRDETYYVFIKGNHLESCFQKAQNFHIAELGFGTGLNFLETLAHWQTHAPQEATLTYTSFELYPLSKEEITRALKPWPDLIARGAAFLKALTFEEGWQEITLEHVTLRLATGDANRLICEIPEAVDAWYLDGFSPAKNPELWNLPLMREVVKNTRPGGTFATYTAAGWVRTMLHDAGFAVERVKGFARKLHMSIGYRPSLSS